MMKIETKFNAKCVVVYTDYEIYLFSYDTFIAMRNRDSNEWRRNPDFYYSTTTAKHIKGVTGLTKSEFMKLKEI